MLSRTRDGSITDYDRSYPPWDRRGHQFWYYLPNSILHSGLIPSIEKDA